MYEYCLVLHAPGAASQEAGRFPAELLLSQTHDGLQYPRLHCLKIEFIIGAWHTDRNRGPLVVSLDVYSP